MKLNNADSAVLRVLRDAVEPLTTARLSIETTYAYTTVWRSLGIMRAAGLVERGATTGRCQHTHRITDAGRALVVKP